MCGGGPLPGNPTTSTSANAPPVSLPVALNVTNSLFAIQTDLPLPGGTCVVLTIWTPSYPHVTSLMIPPPEGPLEEHGVHGDDDRGERHQERRPLGPQHDGVGWVEHPRDYRDREHVVHRGPHQVLFHLADGRLERCWTWAVRASES